MKSRTARTLFLLGVVLCAGVLLTVIGTGARTRSNSAPPSSVAASQITFDQMAQRATLQPARGPVRQTAKPRVSPFNFRAHHLTNALLAPMLSATKDVTVATDVGGNGNSIVNPGDTLRYTVTINNTGNMAATGVSFADTIDANTSFTAGTLIASPIAVNDAAYQTIGNVPFTMNAAGGILANDFNPNAGGPCGACVITQINGSAFSSGAPVATTNGSVTVNSDGSFIYTPNAGFRGPTDSFTYTLGNGTGLTDTATVTISVSGMIWFVDANAAMNGNGRLGTPFNCLTGPGCFDPAAADMAGDNIFLYSSFCIPAPRATTAG